MKPGTAKLRDRKIKTQKRKRNKRVEAQKSVKK